MKFKDMPYTRPDMEKVKKIFKETKGLFCFMLHL